MEYPMEYADFEIMILLADLTEEERKAIATANNIEDQD